MKIELVAYWRDWWRMWSVRLSFVGVALLAFFQEYPDVAITVWSSLPDDLKSVLPEVFVRRVGYVLIASSWIAQFIRQHKLVDRAKARLGWSQQRDPGVLPGSDSDMQATGNPEPGLADGLHGIRDGAAPALQAERSQPGGQ